MSMSELNQLLRARKLTEHEITIYETILAHGPSHAGFISKKTGIHRRNIYDALDRMTQKGLVGYLKENNRKLYSLIDPRQITKQLDDERNAWQSILPQVIAQYQATIERQETVFFRGIAGIKQVFEHQISSIKKGDEILVLATSVHVTTILKHYFPKFQIQRKEKGIKTRMIYDTSYDSALSRAYFKDVPLCKVRYVEGANTSPLAQYIYGDTVALIVWSEQPIAIVIKQKEVASGFRSNFELLWKLGRK